jgi:hypothetical protein
VCKRAWLPCYIAGRAGALNTATARADNAGMLRSRWLLAAALGLAPAPALATAGFAERHAQLAYNDLAPCTGSPWRRL